MSTTILHYRPWQGSFRKPWRSFWPIARVSLAAVFQRRLFWVLYAMGLLLFLMFFFGTYLFDWAQTFFASTTLQIGKVRAEPERMIEFFRRSMRVLNGSNETFAYFFLYQGTMVMVVLALTGSVVIGNDINYRSMAFYLAKPLSRWHYLFGKAIAVGVVVNMLTTLPALLLFAQHGLDEWSYLTDVNYFTAQGMNSPAGWRLLVSIFAFGGVLTVFLSILLLATASWMRRTMPLIMVWASLFLFIRAVAAILVDGLRYHERWRLLDLWNNLVLVGYALLGFEPGEWQPQPRVLEAALVLLGVCLLCLAYLSRRTKAVEIIS